MLLFLPINKPLCYAAVLLKFTYYAQYYAQEQELLSDYYTIHIQFCMNNSLHVADNFIMTALLECINEWYQVCHYALSYGGCSIKVYRSFITIFHKRLILLLHLFYNFLLCWHYA